MNRNTDLEKLAKAVLKLNEEHQELKEKHAALKQEHDLLQKRAMAEDILIACNEQKDAPSGLKSRTIDDFLQKRAKLEKSTNNHLDKIASMVEYFEGDVDYELIDDSKDENHPHNDILHEFLTNRI